MVELFSNWMEATLGEHSLPVQNVQILRFLNSIIEQGLAKRFSEKGVPRYQLTRLGFAQSIARLVNRPSYLPIEKAFFVYYFLRSYGTLFNDLVESDPLVLTPSLRAELTALRDPEIILKNQIRFLEKEIKKLEGRIEETRDASRLANKILGRGGSIEEVITEVEHQYPYELNNRKPLPELMRDLPEGIRVWELTEGLSNRAEFLWEPFREFLVQTQKSFEKLARPQALEK